MFYFWYVCDTLLVMKAQDVSRIHKFMNSFDKNLQFIIDLLEKEVPYFLDLKMSPDGISIYFNDTNTVFCLNNSSFVPSIHLIPWSSWYYFPLKLLRYSKIKLSLMSQKNKITSRHLLLFSVLWGYSIPASKILHT